MSEQRPISPPVSDRLDDAAAAGEGRFAHLDALKALAIFFVCCYHFSLLGDVGYRANPSLWRVVQNALIGVNSVGVPLFFMVNGALLLTRPFDLKKHLLRMLTLALQFLFWRAVTILVLAGSVGFDWSGYGKAGFLNAFLLLQNVPGVNLSHLWFLPTLLSLYLIAPVLILGTREHSGVTALLLITIAALSFLPNAITALQHAFPALMYLNFSALSVFNPFAVLVGPMTFYFLLGGLMQRNLERWRALPLALPVAVFLAGMLLLCGTWFVESRFYDANWDQVWGGYTSFGTPLMAAALFALAARVPQRVYRLNCVANTLRLVGDNTLAVYYLHWILHYACGCALVALLPARGFFINGGKALLQVLLLSLLGAALKRVPVVRRLLR